MLNNSSWMYARDIQNKIVAKNACMVCMAMAGMWSALQAYGVHGHGRHMECIAGMQSAWQWQAYEVHYKHIECMAMAEIWGAWPWQANGVNGGQPTELTCNSGDIGFWQCQRLGLALGSSANPITTT